MITKTTYKNRPAIEVKGNNLTAVFLNEDGGKMASLKSSDGTELLEQAKGDTYLPLTIDGNYVDAECSAFDDMFPTIDPCVLSGHNYLDHGEICRIKQNYEIDGERLVLSCVSESVNALFSKEISADDNGINITYHIKNLNSESLPFIWAGHMMFAAKEGAFVFSNAPKDSDIRVMFGNAPEKPEVIGGFTPDGESYKYYITKPFSPLICGIDYNGNNKLTVSFDGDAVKWLGVWMNNGSFKGMYNIALEPCTAPFDSPVNAEKENVGSTILPNSEISFTMHLHYN